MKYVGNQPVVIGAVGGNNYDKAFYPNENVVDSDYTLVTGYNASSTGPLTIANGVTVTVENGSNMVII